MEQFIFLEQLNPPLELFKVLNTGICTFLVYVRKGQHNVRPVLHIGIFPQVTLILIFTA